MVTTFFTVAPNTVICEFFLWNLLHGTSLESRILRWFLNIWKICASPISNIRIVVFNFSLHSENNKYSVCFYFHTIKHVNVYFVIIHK